MITKKFENILFIFSSKLVILCIIILIKFYLGVQKYATLYFKLKNEMNSFRTTKTLNHCILLDI